MTDCLFPSCGHPATGTNYVGQPMCGGHERVTVATTDDLGDHGRHSDEGDDQ